jgi:hypothetical protein
MRHALTDVTCTGPDGETVGMPVDLAVIGLPIPGAIGIDLAATPNVACTATYTEGAGQSTGTGAGDGSDRDDSDRGLDSARPDDPRGITPREGGWSGTNRRGAIECGGFSQTIPAGNPDRGTIVVRNGGDRLSLRGLNEGATRPIRVDRVEPGSDRFVGTSRLNVQGVRAVFTFTLRVQSETMITGRTSAMVRVQGQQCEVSRPFVLSFDD